MLIVTSLPVQVFAQEAERETSSAQTGVDSISSDPTGSEAPINSEVDPTGTPSGDPTVGTDSTLSSGEGTEDSGQDPAKDQQASDDLTTPPAAPQQADPPIIIDPPEYEPPTTNTDPKSFLSSFQGKADVSLFSGDLGYSFPFFVPQGRANLTPNLSLNYSSNDSRFAGMAGYGWTLPQNAIYRVAREGYDKIYDHDDYFGIDLFGSSQQLMVVDKAKGLYRAKDVGDGVSYEFNKDASVWTVHDTQGNRYIFGQTEVARQVDPEDSTRVFKWMLERMEDVHGNYMTFSYVHDQNAVYPGRIRYTGFGTDSGVFEVRFILEDRSATYADYKTAFRVGYGKQIDKIELWSFEGKTPEVKMAYDLSYQPVNAAVTLLTSIQVQAEGDSLPPTTFAYFDGTESEVDKKLYALKTLHLPYGGESSFTYQSATAYREPDQTSSNWLPFVTYTLKSKTEKAGVNDPASTTTYDYRRGHYYFDALDAYKREYAGFGKVTVTDPVQNKQVLYFHQSEFDPNNQNDAALGEFEDHISKKGRTYRQESYDAQGVLMQEAITQWDKKTLTQGDSPEPRYQVVQKNVVTIDHGKDPNDLKAKASAGVYDDYGNPLEEVDYGQVQVLSPKGDFNDVGQDKLRTEYTYVYNQTSHLLSFPQQVTRFDQADQKIGEMKVTYDNLPYGQIQNGDWTKQERLIDAKNNYATFAQTYTPEGLPETFTNPRGFATHITYEGRRLYPAIVENALGQKNTYEYDLFFGQPIHMQDPNGHDTQTVLDHFGRLESSLVEDAQGQLKKAQDYTYDLVSKPVTLTKTDYLQFKDAQNQDIATTEKTFFDGLNRPIQVKTEAEGNQFVVTSQRYDGRGLVKENILPKFTASPNFEAINANDPKSVLSYDGLGRPVSETNAVGTTTTTYGAWTQTIVDANGHVKDFLADSRGNLAQVKEHNGNEVYSTVYSYDANNNLTQLTDAEGNVSTFSYDLLGRRLTQTLLHKPADNSPATFIFTYDGNGNLLTRQDAKGQITTYSYDQLDRPLTDETPTSTVAYGYDEGNFAIGQLSSIKADEFAKSYQYDLMGRVVQEKKVLPLGGEYETGFAYAGISQNPVQVTYPDGLQVNYVYNNAGQMEAVPGYVSNMDYTPLGSVSVLAYDNGMTTTSTYDPLQLWRMTSRVTTDGKKQYQQIAYTFDPVGNITQILDTSQSSAAKKAVYTYDDLDRLKSATITQTGNGQDYVRTFDYSPTGNMLSKSDVGAYAYNDKHPQAVTQAGDTALSYDLNGSLTASGDFTFGYNDRGLMTSSVGGKQSVQYRYDESGERLNKVVGPDEGVAYVNQYFEQELAPKIEKNRDFVYAGPLKIATITDGTVAFHHDDHLSGANVTTGAKGEVLELADYYPYGEVRIEEKADGYQNDYLYTGQERDEETSLMYYGARYYDAKVGRFMAVDPAPGDPKTPQSLNRYTYVKNNPLKYLDPTGMYDIKAGKVESGDTLGGITKELNDFYATDYSVNDIAKINGISDPNKINVGQRVRIGTLSGWTIPDDPNVVTLDYWNSLSGFRQYLLHFSRNLYQPIPPPTIADLDPNEWIISPYPSTTHNLAGASGNVDYRGIGAREGQQAVYDKDGKLVMTAENKGTYDFGLPTESRLDHKKMDIEPWLRWGNSPQDTTTAQERENAAGGKALDWAEYFNLL